jgi:PAS domain S-box-containing protein
MTFQLVGVLPAATSALIESSGDGLLALDRKGFVVDLNATACGIFGIGEADSIKRRSSAVALRMKQLADSLLGENESVYGPTESGRWYEVRVLPLWSRARSRLRARRAGKPDGAALILRDITERKLAMEAKSERRELQATLREREVLAREMHDDQGQRFAAVRLQLQSALDMLNAGEVDRAKAQLKRLSDTMFTLHQDDRKNLLALRNASREGADFPAIIRDCLNTWSSEHVDSGITLSYEPADLRLLDGLSERAEIQAIRVIQEALLNVERHAHATAVRFSITQDSDALCVRIRDNGVGFDPNIVAPTSSGLIIMRERMKEAFGRVEIDSASGCGTEVRLSFSLGADVFKRDSILSETGRGKV